MSSEKDDVRPYHAPAASSGQETADAVKAVLHHAAERDEAAKHRPAAKKQPKWMLPVGANLGVLALYLLIAPPSWVVLDPVEGPPAAQQVDGLRMAMFLQATRIEDYRIRNGRLPSRLEDAGSAASGVEYRVVGDTQYQLVATAADQALLYDSSGQSPQEWFGPGPAAAKLRGG
jgi:hypothetical protein